MIVALLVLIAAILLFGAGIVRGWLANAFGLLAGGVAVLCAIGFAANRYNAAQAEAEHAALVREAEPMILEGVAAKIEKPIAKLVDIVWYDASGSLYGCGSISGTRGYGGNLGRRRFLSDGGNTEIEQLNDKANFDTRVALHCTVDPDAATILGQ